MPEGDRFQEMARRIIADADGELIGRIRLQKIAYFLTEAGFSDGLDFAYYHYGPYCENLDKALKPACDAKLIAEEEKATEWGTPYYIYKTGEDTNAADADISADGTDVKEKKFVRCAKEFPSVVLELAATALYLYRREGFNSRATGSAWLETERRKKFKARDGRLRQAFEAYEILRKMPSKAALPEIPFPS